MSIAPDARRYRIGPQDAAGPGAIPEQNRCDTLFSELISGTHKSDAHHKYESLDYLSTVACCDSRNVESPERQAKNPLWGRI
ncbi:hypothetical protein [Xanthomonas sp. NCPPB 1128]|uniref:hypothetical protein n=1 Tax=Xanthomonas sp. NCPPB 1128 TaxID=1775876 RepID=UPI001039832C|nr:hypothetical protein [Xanthomonas sp. NCPPB 1128]